MIKVFIHLAKAVVAVIAAVLFASCTGVNGSGKVVTENRKVEGHFTKVNVTSGLEVYVSQGNVAAITVETDDNLQRHIKTEVTGTTLKIYTDKSIMTSSSTRISITLPVVEGLESSGGSTLKANTVVKGTTLTLESSSGSTLQATVEAQKLTLDASSGSTLTASGTADTLISDSSSGSSILAAGITAQTVTADASSGSSIEVNAVQKLTAEAASGSSVRYVKTPVTLDKEVASGGSVEQK